jgi:hypothetical protein
MVPIMHAAERLSSGSPNGIHRAMTTPEQQIQTLANQYTWRGLAETWDLPASYLHDVAHGKRPASDRVLELLGLERVVSYRKRSSKA